MTRKQISLSKETYETLKDKKRPGQSFDGIVQELMEHTELPPQQEVEA